MKLPASVVTSLRPRYEGTTVAVTGGAGFIGGHLVDALHSLGATVRVLDDLSGSSAAQIAGLVDVDPERVRFIHGSILDRAALRDAIEGSDIVFHLAAIVSVPRSVEDPARTWEVNATGTLHVLKAAHEAGASRVALAASSSAYGGGELPALESAAARPLSPYAASKVAAEALAESWARSYGLSTISLRFFNIFGERQPADSPYSAAVAIFTDRILSGQQPVVFGDGEQTRDFTHVSNAVCATLLAGAKPERFLGERVNIATGSSRSLNDLVGLIADTAGVSRVSPVYRPEREGDVRHSRADLTRASELLGYEPVCDLETGLRHAIEWHRAQGVRGKV
ncbi:MAG: SDR family NAD(P)-dependent oxidoreductase [Planctomycetota bacterium]